MTPLQTKQFKAMALAIVSQAEQINRLTDSLIRLSERVEKLDANTKTVTEHSPAWDFAEETGISMVPG